LLDPNTHNSLNQPQWVLYSMLAPSQFVQEPSLEETNFSESITMNGSKNCFKNRSFKLGWGSTPTCDVTISRLIILKIALLFNRLSMPSLLILWYVTIWHTTDCRCETHGVTLDKLSTNEVTIYTQLRATTWWYGNNQT
jgi:hypothetical protein